MKITKLEWIKMIATAVISAVIIIQFFIPSSVYGRSMEPNFFDDDFVLLDRQAYMGDKAPQRGDVVVFTSRLLDKNGKNKKLIKRVIGVGGDRVRVSKGKVYINGKALKEDYTKDGVTNGEFSDVTVPEGKVFCLGDNRLNSTDSRYMEVGFISENDIIGRVFMRVFPFTRITIVGREQ